MLEKGWAMWSSPGGLSRVSELSPSVGSGRHREPAAQAGIIHAYWRYVHRLQFSPKNPTLVIITCPRAKGSSIPEAKTPWPLTSSKRAQGQEIVVTRCMMRSQPSQPTRLRV